MDSGQEGQTGVSTPTTQTTTSTAPDAENLQTNAPEVSAPPETPATAEVANPPTTDVATPLTAENPVNPETTAPEATPDATPNSEAPANSETTATPDATAPEAGTQPRPEDIQAAQPEISEQLMPNVAQIPTLEETNTVGVVNEAEDILRNRTQAEWDEIARQRAAAEAQRQAEQRAREEAEARERELERLRAEEEARRANFDPNFAKKTVNRDIKIETILEACVDRNASDVHLQLGLPPTLRIDGVLTPIGGAPKLSEEKIEELVYATMDEEQKAEFIKDKEFDYSFSFGDKGRFRVNAFRERGNTAAAFRLIPNKIPTLDELNIPAVVSTFADYPRGLVLVTGPTGSGKSTTLAALIDRINSEKAVHIITIEDPIEYAHTSKRALVAQREIHHDTFSFAAALRSALREDPDVVLVGEMRDLETISAAITMAETGHLVFATLHTNSAAQSVDRIVGVFPPDQQQQIRLQLSSVLMAVCSQRLVPKVSGGRIAAAEILVANPGVRAIIREGKTHQLDTSIQTGAEQGMQSMDANLVRLISDGTITYESALEFAVDPENLEKLARG